MRINKNNMRGVVVVSVEVESGSSSIYSSLVSQAVISLRQSVLCDKIRIKNKKRKKNCAFGGAFFGAKKKVFRRVFRRCWEGVFL